MSDEPLQIGPANSPVRGEGLALGGTEPGDVSSDEAGEGGRVNGEHLSCGVHGCSSRARVTGPEAAVCGGDAGEGFGFRMGFRAGMFFSPGHRGDPVVRLGWNGKGQSAKREASESLRFPLYSLRLARLRAHERSISIA